MHTPIDEETLIEQARAVSENAYCPYSNFPVGAAVLAKDGTIYSGCNVENASYPLSVCAERNAIAHMAASGRRRISAIVVFTPTPHPTPPCGGCRQVIFELGPDAVVICACNGSDVIHTTIAELLPGRLRSGNVRRFQFACSSNALPQPSARVEPQWH